MLQKGFTLIELMIVVAIIGILSMFALPAYQDYTKRTYVSEGLALSASAKSAATEQYATEGTWALTSDAAGVAKGDTVVGQAVNSVWVVEGTTGNLDKVAAGAGALDKKAKVSNIIVTYNEKVVGSNATTKNGIGTQPTTAFAKADVPSNGLLIAPVVYADTADQGAIAWVCKANGTELLDKWLPASCRTQVKAQS